MDVWRRSASKVLRNGAVLSSYEICLDATTFGCSEIPRHPCLRESSTVKRRCGGMVGSKWRGRLQHLEYRDVSVRDSPSNGAESRKCITTLMIDCLVIGW